MKSTTSLRGVLSALAWSLVCVDQAFAKTYYVSAGQSIQAAIDGAAAGDRIQVGPGTYTQSISILKAGIDLRGDGATLSPGASMQTACGDFTGICINGDIADVSVMGFTISGFTYGISNVGAKNSKITNNKFMSPGYGYGIQSQGQDTKIQANTFVGSTRSTAQSDTAISVEDKLGVPKIAQNTIQSYFIGISTQTANSNVENNDVSLSGLGIYLLLTADGSVVSHNHIGPGNPGVYGGATGMSVVGLKKFTLDHNTIENMQASGAGLGIRLLDTTGGVITNNVLKNNDQNINSEASSGNTVTKNQCTNPSTGCNY